MLNTTKSSDAHKKFHYVCDKCDYRCSKPFLKAQHVKTKKHTMLINAHTQYDCVCGKVYKHIQSYNRHLKKCEIHQKNTPVQDNINEMLSTLTEQYKNMIDENAEMRRIVSELLPKVGTTINNQININMFLNDHCKDALNLTEFVASLQLNDQDLNSTIENGYAISMSNIFLRGLKALELHKRPIHCSDLKREILYVKDDGVWEKEDEEHSRMKHAFTSVTKKQINSIKEWEQIHEGWQEDEQLSEQYCEIIRNITRPCNIQDQHKIIKSIAREVILRK